MEKRQISKLHPDLVISRSAAIDRIGRTASKSAEEKLPNFIKQIQLVRRMANELCPQYRNCRMEDWCWMCNSGLSGPLHNGEICLGCKLLTSDAAKIHRSGSTSLVQIKVSGSEPDPVLEK